MASTVILRLSHCSLHVFNTVLLSKGSPADGELFPLPGADSWALILLPSKLLFIPQNPNYKLPSLGIFFFFSYLCLSIPVKIFCWFWYSLCSLSISLNLHITFSLNGLPWWLHCRRSGFDPWVRKMPLGKGMATRCSILSWRIPWTAEPGGLSFMGSQSWSVLSD